MHPTTKEKYGYIEGWLSIVINTFLFALKYWAGMVSGSVAIIADAWHTLSDSLTSIVVLVGIKASSKPADSRHPYGHGRAELIASIIIGVLLAVVALNFIVESVRKFINHEPANYGMAAIIATVLSIILKEALAQVAIRMGRKVNAQSLIADGWHHRSDAISSVIILAGIFAGRYFWWIDAALGIAVSLVILYATWEILKNAASTLLGEEVDGEMMQKIREIVSRFNKTDMDPHHFHLHRYGDHLELTFHIRLPAKMELQAAHEIASKIEQAVFNELNIESTIHFEPVFRGQEK